MLVRHQRAIAAFVGGIILMTVVFYGTVNLRNMYAIIFSAIGLIIALVSIWYAYKR